MTAVSVLWLSMEGRERAEDKWDSYLVKELLAGDRYEHHYVTYVLGEPGQFLGAIVVIPGGLHADDEGVQWLCDELAKLEWVVLVITADEGSLFPIDRINHPNMRVWLQTPRRYPANEYLGYCNTSPFRLVAEEMNDEPSLTWSFAGQVTHERRTQALRYLQDVPGNVVHFTDGFNQGIDAKAYFSEMADSRVVVCPSGPRTVDTFRSWEAIEHGAYPLLDGRCLDYGPEVDYWGKVMPGAPISVVHDWKDAPAAVERAAEGWPGNSNRLWSWWQMRKRDLRDTMVKHVAEASGTDLDYGDLTVLITSSPGPEHPSTEMVERVYASVRDRFPDSDVIVLTDGVHESLEDRCEDYERYVHRLLWLAEHQWDRAYVDARGWHAHQTGMIEAVLPRVRTPLLFVMEHDMELVGDWSDRLTGPLYHGEVDVLRVNMDTAVEPAHAHMFIDHEPISLDFAAPVVCGQRTWQWSQRPHFATTAYYRDAALRFAGKKDYVENVMAGVLIEAWQRDGMQGWQRHRVAMWTPGGNQQRCRHLDGRSGDDRYRIAP